MLAPFKDYSKLHIISHYVAVMISAGGNGPIPFQVYPIGKVGGDAAGLRLFEEMKITGMVMNDVQIVPNASTLFSVCFQYPDSTGGNITTADSASGMVAPVDIDAFFEREGGQGTDEVVLAVPEVPLDSRIRLLEQGRSRGSFNAASLLPSEVERFERLNGYVLTDLLAINIDESKAAVGITDEAVPSRQAVEACADKPPDQSPDRAGGHGRALRKLLLVE